MWWPIDWVIGFSLLSMDDWFYSLWHGISLCLYSENGDLIYGFSDTWGLWLDSGTLTGRLVWLSLVDIYNDFGFTILLYFFMSLAYFPSFTMTSCFGALLCLLLYLIWSSTRARNSVTRGCFFVLRVRTLHQHYMLTPGWKFSCFLMQVLGTYLVARFWRCGICNVTRSQVWQYLLFISSPFTVLYYLLLS